MAKRELTANEQYWEDRKWEGLGILIFFVGAAMAAVALIIVVATTMIAGIQAPDQEEVQVCTQTSETTQECRTEWREVQE